MIFYLRVQHVDSDARLNWRPAWSPKSEFLQWIDIYNDPIRQVSENPRCPANADPEVYPPSLRYWTHS